MEYRFVVCVSETLCQSVGLFWTLVMMTGLSRMTSTGLCHSSVVNGLGHPMRSRKKCHPRLASRSVKTLLVKVKIFCIKFSIANMNCIAETSK